VTNVAASLSEHAREWLRSLGASRKRPPYAPERLSAALSPNGLDWAPLFDLEARYGGLTGEGLYVGADGHPSLSLGAPVVADMRWGRPHLSVGYCGPIVWLMNEAGGIVELDDLGHRFYEADSIDKRLEQCALDGCACGLFVERLEGFRGEALASLLGLAPLPAPSDSRQRYWASPGFTRGSADATLVRESHEPRDYGESVYVDLTWVEAGTPARHAVLLEALGRPPREP
jgi:hypothetical protein